MDVARQPNLPEVQMSDCRSFGGNYQFCNQSRKISIGVLVDSLTNMETKNIGKAVKQNAVNVTSTKENLVEDCEGHTSLLKIHATDLQKDASPWISTRSLNPKTSSLVQDHDIEHTPSFLAPSKIYSRTKQSEVSAAHSVKFFSGKTFCIESYEGRQKNFGEATCAMVTGKVNNAEHATNLGFSTQPGVPPKKGLGEDKNRKRETGGSETLRMKLWEIIGNVSSPNKQCPSSQPFNTGTKDSNLDIEKNGKDSPTKKTNPHSDTIESDSERPDHIFQRPLTLSLTLKKASTKNQHIKIEASKSTSNRKGFQENRIFSFRGDRSRRSYDSVNGGLVCSYSKRNKSERKNYGVQTRQAVKYENPEERKQSDNKSKSTPAVEKSMLAGNKSVHANSSNDERRDVLVERESETKKENSLDTPINLMTEQPRVVVESPKLKDQQEAIVDSLLKNKRDCAHNSPSPTFEIKSLVESSPHGRSSISKHVRHHDLSNAEKIIYITRVQSFKDLLNSKSTESKSNAQVELSDGNRKVKGFPFVKPKIIMEEDREPRMSESPTYATDSENSEDDSHIKGCRKPKPLSPEIIAETFLFTPIKRLCNQKGVDLTGRSSMSESLKETGVEESGKEHKYMEQNQDGFASAVALFSVALERVKNKMKSIIGNKSAEILRDSAEEIFLHFQNAESQIKKDVGKLNDLSKSKRKRLDARFQEQQEKLLDIRKRFKLEVGQHLQDCGSVIEDLEELGIQLEGNAERQRAVHKKLLLQVEQAIKVQLDDADSKILAVQELARQKVLQLKLAVAECVKDGAFG